MQFSRRALLKTGLAASTALALGTDVAAVAKDAIAPPQDLHEYLLSVAADFERARRKEFAAVKTLDELKDLQKALRGKFAAWEMQVLLKEDRLAIAIQELLKEDRTPPPARTPPPVKTTGTIEAEDYSIDKLTLEVRPNYFATALLYRPKRIVGKHAPGVISPCGHSPTGKVADTYQILHVNLARRGYYVLTYDPVGQGERSQFWDAEHSRSKYNLTCGEHAVLGNALYTIGMNLAYYRMFDGVRALDYLSSLPEVDPKRLACVGNSGGGTLTAYLGAYDERIHAAAIGCYITTIPRRMATRIASDPDADPEQDLFGFIHHHKASKSGSYPGVDHAGLLALRAPRPTLLCIAQHDFFPVEGARESFAEAQHLFEVAGTRDHIEKVEAPEKHGLTLPLRKGVYRFFDRWLMGGPGDREIEELPVTPRSAKDLQVTVDGQVNLSLKSRHLLSIAWEERPPMVIDKAHPDEFRQGYLADQEAIAPPPGGAKIDLVSRGSKDSTTLMVCINGNEAPVWQQQPEFIAALEGGKHAVAILDPCGVGSRRVKLNIPGSDYADPLMGVEADLAYNAFQLGTSLLQLRVRDVLPAIAVLSNDLQPRRIVLCGRRDAALVAMLVAVVDTNITHLAVEEMLLSYKHLFDTAGRTINAASIAPGLLIAFGDLHAALAEVTPRPVLLAQCELPPDSDKLSLFKEKSLRQIDKRFSSDPRTLLDWLDG